MRKGYLSHRRPAKAQVHKHSLTRNFAVRRHVVENLQKLWEKNCMSVAQIGYCACPFEEP